MLYALPVALMYFGFRVACECLSVALMCWQREQGFLFATAASFAFVIFAEVVKIAREVG